MQVISTSKCLIELAPLLQSSIETPFEVILTLCRHRKRLSLSRRRFLIDFCMKIKLFNQEKSRRCVEGPLRPILQKSFLELQRQSIKARPN